MASINRRHWWRPLNEIPTFYILCDMMLQLSLKFLHLIFYVIFQQYCYWAKYFTSWKIVNNGQWRNIKFSQPFNIFIWCNEICREHTYQIFLLTIILCSTPLLHKKYIMANTHPRCKFPLGINTGVLAAVYDRTAANNNGIIVNASFIGQEELIQAHATVTKQHCCNEPPNINSQLDRTPPPPVRRHHQIAASGRDP